MPIQGTAADIVKIAMIRLDERLRAGGFRARPLLQVHDELLLEVPRDEVDRLVPVLRETMESALPLDVPLTVDIKVGDDWESMTPLTRADAIAAEADEAPDSRRRSRRRSARSAPMPELPEVETVARDLRPRIVGATITGARCSLGADAADPHARGVRCRRSRVGGSRRVGRRAKLVVVELSGDAALTIHLKMTGQLFVVPAETPEDPYVRLVLELADGREVRFRDIRKFGRIGLYGRDPVTGELVTEVGGAAVFAAFGPEPLDPAFTVRDFRRRLRRRIGPAQAAPARPVVPRRRRQHLRRRGAVGGPAPSAADRRARSGRPTSGTCTTRSGRILAEAVERRGSSIDDYTAPDGDGSMQEHLQVYQRTGEPCPRCGRPIKRIVIGARSTHFCSWCQRLGAGRPQGRGGDPADDDRRAASGRPALDGAGGGGDARADGRRGGPGAPRRHGPSERSGPPRPAGRQRAPRRRPSRAPGR